MKKLNDPVRKVNSQSVGLDMHKAVTVYCVLDASGKVVGEGRFASRRCELESFVSKVLEDGEAHVAFEASRSSLWVYEVVSSLTPCPPSGVRLRTVGNSVLSVFTSRSTPSAT